MAKEKAFGKDKGANTAASRIAKDPSSSLKAAAGNPFDRNVMMSIWFVLLLLAVAVIISWVPGLLTKQPSAQQSPVSQQFAPSVGQNTSSQQQATTSACNDSLTNGSERYNYAYLLRYKDNASTTGTMSSILMRNSGQTDVANASYIRETKMSVPIDPTLAAQVGGSLSASMTVHTYLDAKMGCIKSELVVLVGDNEMKLDSACDSVSLDTIEICRDSVNESGTETVTVGAGSFNTKRYVSADNSTVFMSDDIPLPIRISNVMADMDLQSYEKVA